MKNKFSLFAWLLVSVVVAYFRFIPERYQDDKPLVVTTWDALGYYIYLPSFFIYHDYKELKWFPEIDKKYSVSGGWVYQANKCKNGNFVFSYLSGVAILEIPLFLAGHIVASVAGYPADGFSPPYQFAIALGAIFYFILALLLLRKVLLHYFSDLETAAALLLLVLATNIIQYVSVDGAMSHSFIFPLYVLLLYFTIRWHERPTVWSAAWIGAITGLAIISRPTEAIMILIPILWGTHTKEMAAEKWGMVKLHKNHVYVLLISGFAAILPQLIYWKLSAGSFFFELPSRWDFLMPHIRILFWFENGWFIYTPVTVFFIAGMFYMRQFPFRKSVILFCLLSIYIVISHHDWRYGATYSCRALSHMYPVFALPLAAFIRHIGTKKIKYFFLLLGLYLTGVNLFQLKQYNQSILHYRDMNMKYYFSIYLNPHPSPLDISLMDTDERLRNEESYHKAVLVNTDTITKINLQENSEIVLFEKKLDGTPGVVRNRWLKAELIMKLRQEGVYGCYIQSELITPDSTKSNRIRIINPILKPGRDNNYAFYIKIPPRFSDSRFRLLIKSSSLLDCDLKQVRIQYFFN
jgi:hypothetical protein